MNRIFKRLGFATCIALLCSLGLAGCVTSTTGGGPPVNEEQALETHLRTGMAYLQRDNRDAARRHFNKALDLDRRSAEAWQGIAILHQLNGEFDQAEAAFKRALRGRSSISASSTHLAYGRFLYDRKRFGDALEQFEAAAADINYPSRATALLFVGRSAKELGKQERAKAAFEHAVKLDRRQPDALLELAEIYFSERNYPQAKAHLDRFAQLTQHTPRSLWLGIRIERIFGNQDKVASYALALKNMHPYSKEYLEYRRLIEQ
jgi:type IV pilus assembly protein PilF